MNPTISSDLRRLRGCLALLDSSNEGERHAALDRSGKILNKLGKRFADLGLADEPVRLLRSWKACLAGVDPRKPPDRFDAGRWQHLCNDAVWLVGNFGERAARDGWSTADMFGLWPVKPGFGGIADRLTGTRSLIMTDTAACWRSGQNGERFLRGSYPDLQAFWEVI